MIGMYILCSNWYLEQQQHKGNGWTNALFSALSRSWVYFRAKISGYAGEMPQTIHHFSFCHPVQLNVVFIISSSSNSAEPYLFVWWFLVSNTVIPFHFIISLVALGYLSTSPCPIIGAMSLEAANFEKSTVWSTVTSSWCILFFKRLLERNVQLLV